jgi:hypothetical protein
MLQSNALNKLAKTLRPKYLINGTASQTLMDKYAMESPEAKL